MPMRAPCISARIAGVPISTLLKARSEKLDDVRTQLENDVRYANITDRSESA
jgi:hypothetical protein